MKLEECRNEIDTIDASILALLKRRARLSRGIGQIKTVAGLPIVDAVREDQIIRRLRQENDNEIDPATLTRIYREILAESRRIQIAITLEYAEGEPSK